VLLRIQPQRVDAGIQEFADHRREVADFEALHLDTVDRQEILALAGGQFETIRIVDAAEAAIILAEGQRARGEAARRPSHGSRPQAMASIGGSAKPRSPPLRAVAEPVARVPRRAPVVACHR
jgi:hypothetical protein